MINLLITSRIEGNLNWGLLNLFDGLKEQTIVRQLLLGAGGAKNILRKSTLRVLKLEWNRKPFMGALA